MKKINQNSLVQKLRVSPILLSTNLKLRQFFEWMSANFQIAWWLFSSQAKLRFEIRYIIFGGAFKSRVDVYFMHCVLENFLFFMESMVCVEIPEQFKWPHSLFGNLDVYQTHGHHPMGSCPIMVILLMKNSG